MQVDLMEIKPAGEDGERYLLTVICVATRYLFLRAAKSRDAPDLALLLFDICLDMGLIPALSSQTPSLPARRLKSYVPFHI